jgi:RHS repeat-associated protein
MRGGSFCLPENFVDEDTVKHPGQRVQKSSGTNYWSGPGGQVLAETDNSGTWTNYIFFGGQRLARNVSGDIKYYITDHLHSTAMFVDKAGNTAAILDDNDMYPWGGIVPGVGKTTSNNTVKFTGQYRDTESQLDYFGARFYSNTIGRFMSPDWAAKPITVPYAKFGDPQSLNLYSYVENGPVNRIDADGHGFVNEAFQDWGMDGNWADTDKTDSTPQPQDSSSTPPTQSRQPLASPTPGMLTDPTQDENGVCWVEGQSPHDKAIQQEHDSEMAHQASPAGHMRDTSLSDAFVVGGLVKGAAAIVEGIGGGTASEGAVQFAQKGVSSIFRNGEFAGRSVNEVASGLRSGAISPNRLPIQVVTRNGVKYAMNNRSLMALRQAGMSPTRLIDVTGNTFFEQQLTTRLAEMGGSSSAGFVPTVRGR